MAKASYASYPYIVAYHRLTGSRDYYIREMVERAARDNAPPETVCWRSDGFKMSLDDLASPVFREQVRKAGDKIKGK